MGGGIGQWLLYRADDGSLSLFSLVVPPGSETPIHDHLAWGLVGLYRGTQDEEIYAQRGGALELVEQRSLEPGDFYVLIPPRDDIHRVRTTSAETSVSIHLLTNDTGCVWRHAWDTAPARQGRSAPATSTCLRRRLIASGQVTRSRRRPWSRPASLVRVTRSPTGALCGRRARRDAPPAYHARARGLVRARGLGAGVSDRHDAEVRPEAARRQGGRVRRHQVGVSYRFGGISRRPASTARASSTRPTARSGG
jgi:hypothetical protein